MAGRGQYDKSERRNRHPAAHPSDLDQFGHQMGGDKIAPGEDMPVCDRRDGNRK